MRILRFAALVTSLLLAALATQIFFHRTLDGFFPSWLIARAPWLTAYERFVESDVLALGQWMALLALLLFGLAIPAQRLSIRRHVATEDGARPRTFWLVLFGMALAGALLLALLPVFGVQSWVTPALWLAAIAGVLFFAERLEARRRSFLVDDSSGSPERGWPWLIVLLALAGVLYAWKLGESPLTLPQESVAAALQAQDVAGLVRNGPLARGESGVAWLATASTAVGQAIASNPFRGLAAVSLLWALLMVAATWLLGCELLRAGEPGDAEDAAGAAPPLIAAGVAAISLAVVAWSRLPLQLEGIAWGTAGIWALLRAARLGALRWAALSGVFSAMALLYSPANGLLLVVALIVWAGLALLRRGWLQTAKGGIGWRGFGLWLAALLVTGAPLACLGDCSTQGAWWSGIGSAGTSLASILAAVGIPALGASEFPVSLTIAGVLIAPMLLLSLSALVFHLDQIVGWTLLPWLALATFAAARQSRGEVDWNTLLVMVPGAAVAVAFALDRLRAGVDLSVGAWSHAAVTTLTAGLVLLAGILAWRSYPAFANVASSSADSFSAAARWVAQEQEAPGFLFVGPDGASLAEDPLIRFALDGRTTPIQGADAYTGTVAPGWQVVIFPSETDAVTAAEQSGRGALRTVSDLRGNALLYVYSEDAAAQQDDGR